jgi:hypothetical protein
VKPARSAGLRERLFSGMSPGLPPPVTYVPFGQECPYRSEFNLPESQVHAVVVVLAAEAVGLGPVTKQQIDEVCDFAAHAVLALERQGWLECMGKVPGTNAKLWRGSKKAKRVLGLAGWKAEAAGGG